VPGSLEATRLFYKFTIYLLTHTSNQNEKIMSFAVSLVSSLTYSVVYLLSQNPNALEWEANIQNISIVVVNITLLYPYGC
jgi:hypothetical protein